MKPNSFLKQLDKTHLTGLVIVLFFNTFSSFSQSIELSPSELESLMNENRINQLDDYANIYSKFEIHVSSDENVTIEQIQSKLKSLPGVVEVKVNEEKTIVEVKLKKQRNENPVPLIKKELAAINLRIMSLNETFFKN
jgi:hypothetical protein